MKPWLFFFLLLFLFTSCCTIIKPKSANIGMLIEVRTSDNTSTDPDNCDGWIKIVNPAPTDPNVTYSWSHDEKFSKNEIFDLCPGHYKITVTEKTKKRVTQVIIN